MNAPESPCRMRPSIRKVPPRPPDGARPTSSEPAILSTKPHCTTRTRPKRSARLPITTMKMPEKSAVIETAMFMTVVSTPRSSAITGEIFSVVCANSQKASTPKMMPKRTRSLPTKSVCERASVVTVASDYLMGGLVMTPEEANQTRTLASTGASAGVYAGAVVLARRERISTASTALCHGLGRKCFSAVTIRASA